MKIELDFELGDRVIIDDDPSILATVTGFWIKASNLYCVQCAYLHNGTAFEPWIESTRVRYIKS